MSSKDSNDQDSNAQDKRVTRSQIINKSQVSNKSRMINKSKTASREKKLLPIKSKETVNDHHISSGQFTKIIIPNPAQLFSAPESNNCFSRLEERYLNTLSDKQKSKIIKDFKSTSSQVKVPIRFRILESNLPNKPDILQRLSNSCEGGKFDTWLDALLSLPIGKLAPPPVTQMDKMAPFLKKTRTEMDCAVYGQHEAKDEILRLLCQWSASGSLNSFAIALEGPPGIGKTTFAKNVVSNVMNRPFNFISLGGATDAAHLLGHSYTYEGAIPGRIAEALKTSGVMNPCFYFDELDKISKTPKGDEIANILVHLTDREQNSNFHDRYFNGIHLDISQALYIFSFNNIHDISPVLLDRLNIIKLAAPSVDDKINIAKLHLIPRALKTSALKEEEFDLNDDHIRHIIEKYTNENGVRNLEKAICKIISTFGVVAHAPDVLRSIQLKGRVCTVSEIDRILSSNVQNSGNHLSMYM